MKFNRLENPSFTDRYLVHLIRFPIVLHSKTGIDLLVMKFSKIFLTRKKTVQCNTNNKYIDETSILKSSKHISAQIPYPSRAGD